MNILLAILGSLAAIVSVILIHETGHFIVARLCGVYVERFSIGFGKVLWRKKDKRGTEYCLSLLPLGGYVKMLGETGDEPVEPALQSQAFSHKPILARLAIVAAGPVTNFILAIVLFWAVFLANLPQLKPVIGDVQPNTIAEAAGLKPGQTIVAIDDHSTPNWQQVVIRLFYRLGDEGLMKIDTMAPPQTHLLHVDLWQLNNKKPDPLGSLGFKPYMPPWPPIVQQVAPHSPADKAGLKPGDRLVRMEQKAVNNWMTVSDFLQQHPGKTITLTWERKN